MNKELKRELVLDLSEIICNRLEEYNPRITTQPLSEYVAEGIVENGYHVGISNEQLEAESKLIKYQFNYINTKEYVSCLIKTYQTRINELKYKLENSTGYAHDTLRNELCICDSIIIVLTAVLKEFRIEDVKLV